MKLNLSEEEKIIRKKMYSIWSDMKQRCYNSNCKSYKWYGGRGISVCDRWKFFENFYEDMKDTWFIGATIDRIDNDGNYEPENCQWLNRSENTSKMLYERVKNGTNIFCNSELGSKWQKELVSKGIHPFLGGEISRKINKKRIENGTFHLLGKGRDDHPGKKNIGKIAITNKIEEKHINPEELPKFLNEGWFRGEKPKIKKECQYCKKFFDPGNFAKLHGENCKLKLQENFL